MEFGDFQRRNLMKAAVIDRFGGPEEIYYTDIEKPVPGPDEVLPRLLVCVDRALV